MPTLLRNVGSPEDVGSTYLRNGGIYRPVHTAPKPNNIIIIVFTAVKTSNLPCLCFCDAQHRLPCYGILPRMYNNFQCCSGRKWNDLMFFNMLCFIQVTGMKKNISGITGSIWNMMYWKNDFSKFTFEMYSVIKAASHHCIGQEVINFFPKL